MRSHHEVVRPLLADGAERATRYLEGLEDRAVAPAPAALAQLARLDTPLPDTPSDPAEVLALLDDVGSPATMAMAGSRFFGFVIGGALPVTVAASWLSTAWDQNACLYRVTPGVAHLEQVALRWLVELLRLPAQCGGAFVTGATVANFTALAAARHAVLDRVGWNVEADGLFGAPPITVVVGDEVHPSLTKSLGLLGLGRTRVVTVPVDAAGCMRADRLPPLDGPTIVCMQAGNVNTGGFDPATELAAATRAAGAWLHVDGAFGLWAAASPAHAHLAAGISLADSWATDAHKWLNVPYDSGVAFVRDPDALQAAMAITAAYLPTATPFRNPSDFTPELSRRGRGVEVWAALRQLGREGVAALIARSCRHASRFAEGFRAAGLEVLNDVVLNQVLVSFGDAETTKRVIDAVQAEGTCWCGVTQWQGHTAMRVSVSSWATTDQDVERSLTAIVRVARANTSTAAGSSQAGVRGVSHA
ncbi:MAG: aspartate aminotransferase family protein [Gemmatimonadetes bacterium]|nr:aspartate aminotransferase family protein [Gemmatimonadota bacterium]